MYWKLNRIQFPIYNLGPSKRIAIWTQGCSIKCKSCLSPDLWCFNKGKAVNILHLCSQILKMKNQYNGITITGGEPFDQYSSLLLFCSYIKKKSDLNIYVFSGYKLQNLLKKYKNKLFLKYIDFLLDGEYIKEKHEDKNLRGSTNQNLFEFKNSKVNKLNKFFYNTTWSLSLSKDNKIHLSGIPKKDDLKTIKKTFLEKGIKVEF